MYEWLTKENDDYTTIEIVIEDLDEHSFVDWVQSRRNEFIN